MGSSVNKVLLIGRLGGDPEVRYTSNGGAVANFTLATNETWNDKSGQKQERTEWHRVVVWGKLGELCGQYLSKGRQAYIEGRLQTRDWTDKEGHKRYTTEVVAQNVVFLGSSAGTGASAGMNTGTTPGMTAPSVPDFQPSPAAEFGSGGGAEEEVPF